MKGRITTAGAVVLVAVMALLGGASAGAAREHAGPDARAARTIDVTERARLRLVKKSGSTLLEQGTATGTLPGNVTARFEIALTRVTGTVTIYPRGGGSLRIAVDGRARSAGTVARFDGTMRIAGGTGRYAGASGSGRFEGKVNRRTWAATVHATGRLTY